MALSSGAKAVPLLLGPVALADIETRLASEGGGRVGLLVGGALPVLVAGFRRGERPEQTLALWRTRTEAVILFARRHRARVTLVSASAVRHDPATAMAALSAGPGKRVAPPVPAEAIPPATPLERLMAALLCAADPEVTALDAELAASCLPLADPEAAAPAEIGAAVLAALEGAGRTGSGEETARAEELDRLLAMREAELAELAYVQERAAEIDLLAARAAEAQDLNEALQRRIVEAEAARAGAEAERDRLREETENRLAALRGELDEARARIDALLGSTSWRVSAPIRGVGRLLGR